MLRIQGESNWSCIFTMEIGKIWSEDIWEKIDEVIDKYIRKLMSKLIRGGGECKGNEGGKKLETKNIVFLM